MLGTSLRFFFEPCLLNRNKLLKTINTPRALTQGMSWNVKSGDLRKSFHANIKTLNPSLSRVHLALPMRSRAFLPDPMPQLMTSVDSGVIAVSISLESAPDSRRNVFHVTKQRSFSELAALWQWLSMAGAASLDMTNYSFKVLLTCASGREYSQTWSIRVTSSRRLKNCLVRVTDENIPTTHAA